MTWAEVIRKLKQAGYVKVRHGSSHTLYRNPRTGQEVWVARHTKRDARNLGNKILREAGIK